ncbi:MAG: YhjD/YihY/BrkB family envelope integrity protein, partial [Coprobacillaceae bacterium]
MKKLLNNIFDALLLFLSQEARIFRYSLSYCLILALFPTVIVIFTMFYMGFFDIEKIIDVNQMIEISKSFKLDQFITPLIETLQKNPFTNLGSSIITILISCFMASNSLYSFMLITAQQEKFATYGLLIRIKAVFVFIGLILSILGIVIIAYLSPVRIRTIGIFAIFVFLYLFFRSLSFVKRPIWYGLPGTIFSGVAIGILSFMFLKVLEIVNYGSIYGTLASLMGALLAV